MDLGFKLSGCNIIWANDVFPEAVETYKYNIDQNIVLGDITQISSNEIPNNPDIVIGGFPCQGFSVANNNRSMEDKRNFLYKELLRIIRDKQPKFFVAENVKGLLSIENGEVIKLIIKDFENIGYKVDYKVLNAADFGVPQARERVIIIGNRLGIDNVFPEPTHSKNGKKGQTKHISVKDAIEDLSAIEISKEDILLQDGQTIYNHIAYTNVAEKFFGRKYEVDQIELCAYLRKYKNKAKLSNKKIAELMNLPQTKVEHWFRDDNNSGSIPSKEDYLKLKEILNLDDTYEKELTEYEEKEIKFDQSLRITKWDAPSRTITATTPEIHINKQRRLSVRECARLQTFPDDFKFFGTIDKQYRQVGNAVPVKLAEAIAKEIISVLKGENP